MVTFDQCQVDLCAPGSTPEELPIRKRTTLIMTNAACIESEFNAWWTISKQLEWGEPEQALPGIHTKILWASGTGHFEAEGTFDWEAVSQPIMQIQ